MAFFSGGVACFFRSPGTPPFRRRVGPCQAGRRAIPRREPDGLHPGPSPDMPRIREISKQTGWWFADQTLGETMDNG